MFQEARPRMAFADQSISASVVDLSGDRDAHHLLSVPRGPAEPAGAIVLNTADHVLRKRVDVTAALRR
jgi:hypothetical protein